MNLREETICNRITEWDKHQSDKRWNCVSDVFPVDSNNLSHHHRADLPVISVVQGVCSGVDRHTITNVHPVAQGGIEAKIGAKKREMMKHSPVVMAVKPVLPPSAIPAPDSINAVTGDVPKRLPIEIENASAQ